MPGAKMPPEAPRAHRKRGSEDAQQRQRDDQPEGEVHHIFGGDGTLHPAVPDVNGFGGEHPDAAHEDAANSRLHPARGGEAPEELLRSLEAARVEDAEQPAGHPQREVVRQLLGILEGEARRPAENRRVVVPGPVDGEGDDRGDEREQDRVRLEVVAVEGLGGHHRAAEGGAEDGAHARAHARHQRAPPLDRVEAEPVGDDRADAAGDLRRRTLPSGRATAPDRDRGGDKLHRDRAQANASAALVEGVDHLVGARPLRLGGEGVHEEARDERAQPHDDRQGPAPRRVGGFLAALAQGMGRVVARQVGKQVLVANSSASKKRMATKPVTTPIRAPSHNARMTSWVVTRPRRRRRRPPARLLQRRPRARLIATR